MGPPKELIECNCYTFLSLWFRLLVAGRVEPPARGRQEAGLRTRQPAIMKFAKGWIVGKC